MPSAGLGALLTRPCFVPVVTMPALDLARSKEELQASDGG